MTAHHFLITRLDSGRLAGHALLCPDASYATVRWQNGDRLERRFAAPTTWRAIEADLQIGWEKGVVAGASATARVLLAEDRARLLILQQLTAVPIDVAPGEVAATLDRYLRQQAWS